MPEHANVYSRSDWSLRKAQGANNFLSGCPGFVVEALGMVLIAMLAYSLSMQTGGLGSALAPVVGGYWLWAASVCCPPCSKYMGRGLQLSVARRI
jgi:ATP-binding cassette subfamily B protein